MQWSKIYGWEHYDIPKSVIPLKDGFLLTAYSWDYGTQASDIQLLKIDRNGEIVFRQLYGTQALDAGHRVIQSTDGGYLILGYTRGIEPRGDFILIKTDSMGNELWRQNYGTNMDDIAFGLYQNDDGNILILGSIGSFYYSVHYNFHNHDADMLLIQTDPNGNELWRKTYGEDGHDLGFAIKPSPDGGYYLFGSSQSFGANSFDMLLVKVDESGSEEWHRLYGGDEYEYGLSMDVSSENELFLFGTTKSFGYGNSADYYLLKTDAEGDIIWQTTLGGNDADFGNTVVATADSGCAVIGATKSFGEGEQDLLFVKLDKDGVIENLLNDTGDCFSTTSLIYPNPATHSGQLKLSGGSTHYKMDLVAMDGSLVRSYELRSPDYRFSVEHLASGMYFYRISRPDKEGQFFMGKLLVH
ncbi:MAG: T9SS type A sorting domain-containing protein [Bacteroidales bacterium]|nr:T9SS type A sorting domain-containing protein [Bacteroidales bacterium]MCF6341825.1 T9SS type A sorting domain-containing protein [Bacteroidales bacterium]